MIPVDVEGSSPAWTEWAADVMIEQYMALED